MAIYKDGAKFNNMNLPDAENTPKHEDTSIDAVLKKRGEVYGKFTSHAEITQNIKYEMCATPGWNSLFPDQKEALEMIAHKIGRILNGNPDYADSWKDIAGYAQLVCSRLEGKIL